MQYKKQVIGAMPGALDGMFGQFGFDIIRGEAAFVFDKGNHLVGAAVMSEDAGVYIDFLTLINNNKTTAMELGKMIFAFPTVTYGLVGTLMPLMLKK